MSEVCENDARRLEYFILIEHACSHSSSLSFSTLSILSLYYEAQQM